MNKLSFPQREAPCRGRIYAARSCTADDLLRETSQAIYDRYASNYIPRNFLIGADGKVMLATVGYDAEEFDEMIKTIEKTLE